MLKHIAAACLLGTALAAAPAFAQDSTTAPSNTAPSNATPPVQAANAPGAPSAQFLTKMDVEQWRGSKLVGVDVYGADNSKIGDINEVILDRHGNAKAVVIGVGGFLGIGEKNVAIGWDQVTWTTGGVASSVSSAATVSPGAQPSAGRDMAQSTTGASTDANAPAAQAAAGGAALSSAPSTTMSGDAPATSTAPAPATSAAPATTPSTATATAGAPTMGQDYPDRAMISMSKQDLQNAPDFQYASQAAPAGGAANNGAAGTTTR